MASRAETFRRLRARSDDHEAVARRHFLAAVQYRYVGDIWMAEQIEYLALARLTEARDMAATAADVAGF